MPRHGRFTKFMVHERHSSDRKIRQLTDGQYRAWMGGVMCLASQARPERGLLVVDGIVPVTPADVAAESGASVEDAHAVLEILAGNGFLTPEERGDRVTNWHLYQPHVKPSDQPSATAERQRRSRAARQAREREQAETGQTPQLTIGQGAGTPLKAVSTDPEDGVPQPPPPLPATVRSRTARAKHTQDEERYRRDLGDWFYPFLSRHFPELDASSRLFNTVDKAIRMGAQTEAGVRDAVVVLIEAEDARRQSVRDAGAA